ncbi:histone-lysine N-methyltransferase SETMAR [Trichonephila clavipes]|uniref:Histone-lysine N-methyltransferase SETMAR n=1 Tax=Trichonephila clavipes TaxID=2585209 RepID=A0A8X6RVR8_TRICX|nr:histone-lysine N-methyltransferase SETMAR [Trichonephila clavipes]
MRKFVCTISQLSKYFSDSPGNIRLPEVLRSMGTENALKTSRMGASLEFLFRYHTYGEDFLNRMVTGDKTWVAHVNAVTKQQSISWGHTGSPIRLRKARQTLSAMNLMVTVFWDAQGI